MSAIDKEAIKLSDTERESIINLLYRVKGNREQAQNGDLVPWNRLEENLNDLSSMIKAPETSPTITFVFQGIRSTESGPSQRIEHRVVINNPMAITTESTGYSFIVDLLPRETIVGSLPKGFESLPVRPPANTPTTNTWPSR